MLLKVQILLANFVPWKMSWKVKNFLLCHSLFPKKFNFNYTLQGTKFANRICTFHSIFYMLFYFKKAFYACCETCNVIQTKNGLWEYSIMGKSHFIDLNLVQCSVGQVRDQGKWRFINRSGHTAHIEVASPATLAQSSITDILTSDGFESNSSSGNGSTGMSEDSSSLWSTGRDREAMSTSSLSEDV